MAPASRSRRSRTASPGELVVRTGAREDAEAISRVRARTWQSAYAHIFPAEQLEAIEAERWFEWWRGVLTDPAPRTHTLVGEESGRVSGFVSTGPARDEPGVGELYAIYVLPEASGQGLGQALMIEALLRLRVEGFPEAILWVLEDNPRTRRFYEQTGWHADGGSKDEELLSTLVRELRYRIMLDPPR